MYEMKSTFMKILTTFMKLVLGLFLNQQNQSLQLLVIKLLDMAHFFYRHVELNMHMAHVIGCKRYALTESNMIQMLSASWQQLLDSSMREITNMDITNIFI